MADPGFPYFGPVVNKTTIVVELEDDIEACYFFLVVEAGSL